MNEHEWLARRFEQNRPHLRAVAYRMLGSLAEADDAVQETWLRLSRADRDDVDNLGGWLTTVVGRVCLDMLRARRSRREESFDTYAPDRALSTDDTNPEDEALLADSVGAAMIVVLQALPPAERVTFVLHDMFSVPFDEIATIVGRSPAAARQLASRARRRVQGAGVSPEADLVRKRAVVDAFLAASRSGNFEALLEVLDPDVVVRADAAAVAMGAAGEVRGAQDVAETFAGRARAAQRALIDGSPGLVWLQGGRPRVVFAFVISDGAVHEIQMVADPERIEALAVAMI
ncbi:MAG TPA: sigma-70 family RNA polymerase sigma factor [Jiangellaceae bacterium]|nr:sigma-70 family RNA polymerase sigma factor [Jiangellaceae bacterium]